MVTPPKNSWTITITMAGFAASTMPESFPLPMAEPKQRGREAERQRGREKEEEEEDEEEEEGRRFQYVAFLIYIYKEGEADKNPSCQTDLLLKTNIGLQYGICKLIHASKK